MSQDAPNPRPQPDSLIIGEIVGPFGIKGELKVYILTEFPDRFKKLEAVILVPPERPGGKDLGSVAARSARTGTPKPQTHIIESVRLHRGLALVKLEGVNDANGAEKLRGYLMTIPIERAKKLKRGEYYLYQIEGLDVYTTAGELVGKLEQVLSMSSNDVYVVRGAGVTDPTGELLVPAIKDIVKKIDVEAGRIEIAPPSEWA